jgi:SPP1 gp7 family putative phage head morphogenesis protein
VIRAYDAEAARSRSAEPKPIKLRPVHPNAGVEAELRRRILRMVDDMHRSVVHWVIAAYRADPPRMAADTPAGSMQDAIDDLVRRWQKKFDEGAAALADYFARDVLHRTDAGLKAALRKTGMTARFVMTPAQRDVLDATIEQSVGLIKSIPQKYLGDVQGAVMRSVQTGRDLSMLSKELRKSYGITRRRAELIARDQNNKATSAMTRARQVELGIEEAIWLHSHAGRVPRPTHVAMNGKKYDVTKGMWDSDEGRYVFPGELINCRCVSKSVVRGFL